MRVCVCACACVRVCKEAGMVLHGRVAPNNEPCMYVLYMRERGSYGNYVA